MKVSCGAPPRIARWILRWITPAAERDAVEGDLVESFELRATRNGDAEARRWFRREVVRSLPPLALCTFLESGVVRWPVGILLGILLTTFAPDALGDAVGRWSSEGYAEVSRTFYFFLASGVAVVGGYWSARVAGIRRVASLSVIVAILYGPAFLAIARSPRPSPTDALAGTLVCAMAFAGGMLRLRRRPELAS